MKHLLLSLALLLGVASADALTLYPDSETAKSEVELGVEGIQRLCPTGMWDHWVFRDIPLAFTADQLKTIKSDKKY